MNHNLNAQIPVSFPSPSIIQALTPDIFSICGDMDQVFGARKEQGSGKKRAKSNIWFGFSFGRTAITELKFHLYS